MTPFLRTATVALALCLSALPALAQDARKPLDLKLAPGSVPAAAASSASSGTTPTQTPAGVYYGDTSGRIYSQATTQRTAAPCDEDRYGQTQVHGSVGAGVVAGGHVSGQSQSATVHLSKAFGSCDHPSGGVSISIGVRRDDVHVDGHR